MEKGLRMLQRVSLSPALYYNSNSTISSWLSLYHSEGLQSDGMHGADSYLALTHCEQSTR